MSSRTQRVLIVGGGPAGSTAAFWLARAGFDVQIAELSTRAPYGQGIDVTDGAVTVVKAMGLFETIKAQTTGETGFALLDDQAREIGRVGTNPADDKQAGFSPTQEIEIMRGTLTNILVDAAKAEGVRYRYGCTLTEIEQTSQQSVSAKLSDTDEVETFDAIIGADGVASRVRKLAFPAEVNANPFAQTDTYIAFFSMNADPHSRQTHSRLQHGDKGRIIWLRPIDNKGERLSCYFIITSPNNAKLQALAHSGVPQDQRKAFLDDHFRDMEGLKDEAIRGMHESTDFYFTRVARVELPTWNEGRCGLVGDAACCPSPLSGQGTTCALIGGYMIAGELAANPSDPAAAFAEYRRKMVDFVQDECAIPLGGRMPKVAAPQTRLGVWTLRTVFWALARMNLPWLAAHMPDFGSGDSKKFQVPTYTFEQASVR